MPSLPSLLLSVEALHGFAEQVAEVRVPALQDDVPDTVYPELHVGWHVEPLARELVQPPAPPFVGAADASHEFPLHIAVLVRVPALHDLCPDKVYPESHVGEHDAPCARVEVQAEPGAPLAMAPDASQDEGACIGAYAQI